MRWSSRSPVAAWSTSNRTVPTSAIDVVGEAKLGSGAETTATNKADTRSDTFMREIVNPSMPPLCAPSMFNLLVQPNDTWTGLCNATTLATLAHVAPTSTSDPSS